MSSYLRQALDAYRVLENTDCICGVNEPACSFCSAFTQLGNVLSTLAELNGIDVDEDNSRTVAKAESEG